MPFRNNLRINKIKLNLAFRVICGDKCRKNKASPASAWRRCQDWDLSMFISLGAVERSPGFILLLCFRHCDFQRRMGPFERSVAVYASIDHSDLTGCRLQPASFGGTATLPLAFTKPRPVVGIS